jgi:peptide/nickel transport system permease protein
MWIKLRRHRLALTGGAVLVIFYLCAFLAPLLSPYPIYEAFDRYIFAPPQRIHFVHKGVFGFRPFVYLLKESRDPVTLRRTYAEDLDQIAYLRFFAKGFEYKILNTVKWDIHLFIVDRPGTVFLFGTDNLGRDMFSRCLSAAGISLTVGLIGVALSFVLGCVIGAISGYYGGRVDLIIQRIIEILLAIPSIPLWMALSAAIPRDWTQVQVYFAITVILALRGWCGLARVVRGKLMSTRDLDFVKAAKIAGASNSRIILRHLLPGFLSYLIVDVTLAIPGMIIGETALSFLGLGLQPPVVSWGVLLSQAQNIRTIAQAPWCLIPGLFVVFAVLSFNLIGDGLRDAADPYKMV